MQTVRFLFFFVHPGKYHLFKFLIRNLINQGHQVDVFIITKDILEDLIKQEGWNYVNIFPEGRRINGIPVIIATIINFFRTLFRLLKQTWGKKYDFYLSDDVLSVVGWLKGVKSFHFQDDDYKAVPESTLLLGASTKTFAPETTDLGKFNDKKISYRGLHELAYLHPNRFTPDKSVLDELNLNGNKYYILRLVSLTASHDVGKKGLDNDLVQKLINILQKHGRVFITAERELPAQFEQFRIKVSPEKIGHLMYFAEMFIGDSQTMTTEAAVLGVPSLRCNSFVGLIRSMAEMEDKYGLTWGFLPNDFNKLILKVQELLQEKDLRGEMRKKRAIMLEDKIDFSTFMIDYFEKEINNCF